MFHLRAPAGGTKGGGKGDDGPKADLSKFDLKPLDSQVKKSLDILQSDLRSLRVGAANPSMAPWDATAFSCATGAKAL